LMVLMVLMVLLLLLGCGGATVVAAAAPAGGQHPVTRSLILFLILDFGLAELAERVASQTDQPDGVVVAAGDWVHVCLDQERVAGSEGNAEFLHGCFGGRCTDCLLVLSLEEERELAGNPAGDGGDVDDLSLFERVGVGASVEATGCGGGRCVIWMVESEAGVPCRARNVICTICWYGVAHGEGGRGRRGGATTLFEK